ncbi:MAG: ATP-binding cassette domain-containing protein [Gemmatimonadota bacterium]
MATPRAPETIVRRSFRPLSPLCPLCPLCPLRPSRPPVRMITFDHVSKSFGDRHVLREMSLEIPDGQTTVIIGFSGVGKSVALKHIVGLLEPDSGRVIVDGKTVADLSHEELVEMRGTIGYVFQFAALFDSMTVEENLRLGLARRGLDEATIRSRVSESLALVDLAGAEQRLPAELSGGMRKRVGIARAIALRPRYILYDEPTTGLDPVTSAVIDRLMVRTRAELGVTSVVVTHDMRSAYTVGDRIAMLYEGAIRQAGTAEEIRETSDPVVRQFIEGRPDPVEPVLEGAR